ncbi:uncharacterized protein LOC133299552 [Gastrolobium bilobum]|uniref:uncharacterized protein LOC133299552 n=1 Tax=Gastrolobium bilobum TaxID=150636 RepID=UPI002AB16768|nr:uncharacterized protein LOC133299552 [Gastrolobium bilobum]
MEEFFNQSRRDFLELYVDIAATENVPLPVMSVDLNSTRLPASPAAHASPVGDEAVIPFWEGILHYSYIDWSYRSEQESCTVGTVSGSGSIQGETLEAWDYFLVNIRAHVTTMSNICLISDRHRSIISAVENNPNWQPPNAYHVFCIRHIARNFNQKFWNEGLKRMLKNLGYTPAMVDFERNLASFRESSPQIAEWIDAIPKEKWSRAYNIEGQRYGHMTTNLAESVNRVLKGARNMPITALVKHTYSRLVHYFVERGTKVVAQLESAHRHCKNVVELVKKNQVDATGHHVRAYNVEHTVFEVDTGWERSYSVNLPQGFCQCGKFKAFKYPCSHVTVAALSVRQSPFTYVDDVFLTKNLVKAYSFPWEPIGNEEAIPELGGAKIIPDKNMLRAKGLPKSTRIRNEMDEVETSQSRIRCGLCKERGHNRRGCPNRGRND